MRKRWVNRKKNQYGVSATGRHYQVRIMHRHCCLTGQKGVRYCRNTLAACLAACALAPRLWPLLRPPLRAQQGHREPHCCLLLALVETISRTGTNIEKGEHISAAACSCALKSEYGKLCAAGGGVPLVAATNTHVLPSPGRKEFGDWLWISFAAASEHCKLQSNCGSNGNGTRGSPRVCRHSHSAGVFQGTAAVYGLFQLQGSFIAWLQPQDEFASQALKMQAQVQHHSSRIRRQLFPPASSPGLHVPGQQWVISSWSWLPLITSSIAATVFLLWWWHSCIW